MLPDSLNFNTLAMVSEQAEPFLGFWGAMEVSHSATCPMQCPADIPATATLLPAQQVVTLRCGPWNKSLAGDY